MQISARPRGTLANTQTPLQAVGPSLAQWRVGWEKSRPMLYPSATPGTRSPEKESLIVGVSKRVDVELKKRWFKQKAGDFMATRKRAAAKSRKMILTAVIGSLAALGIGGAGYVTWSAIKGSEAAQTVEATYGGQKTSTSSHIAHRSVASSHSKATKSRRLKAGTSCKITKSKSHKGSKYTASKHKRKKLRHAH